MRTTFALLALALALAAPAAAGAAETAVPGDFKVISTQDLGGGKVRVTLKAYHRLGAFTGDKTYEDRWAVPQDLLAKEYIPVKREWGSFEGKGVLLYEEMKREGYLARIRLDKALVASGDVRFKLAIVLANDGTLPVPGAEPTLVSPLSGVHEYKPGDILPLVWKGAGPNYRVTLFSETHGQAVVTAQVRKPELRVNTAVLGRNAVYAWTVQQADDGLAFGPAAVEKFRVFTRQMLEWVTCRTCNGTGQIFVPDPPPTPQPHKTGKGQQVCPTCHGSGRVSEWVEHFFLDFNL